MNISKLLSVLIELADAVSSDAICSCGGAGGGGNKSNDRSKSTDGILLTVDFMMLFGIFGGLDLGGGAGGSGKLVSVAVDLTVFELDFESFLILLLFLVFAFSTCCCLLFFIIELFPSSFLCMVPVLASYVNRT